MLNATPAQLKRLDVNVTPAYHGAGHGLNNGRTETGGGGLSRRCGGLCVRGAQHDDGAVIGNNFKPLSAIALRKAACASDRVDAFIHQIRLWSDDLQAALSRLSRYIIFTRDRLRLNYAEGSQNSDDRLGKAFGILGLEIADHL